MALFKSSGNSRPTVDVATPGAALTDHDPADNAGVLLGSLRSDVDERDSIAEPFERIALVTEGVITAYRRRALTAEQAAERLALLRLRDDSGADWTLGATGRRWYRRLPGGVWKLAAVPDETDRSLSATANEAIDALIAKDADLFPDPAPAPAVLPAPSTESTGAGSAGVAEAGGLTRDASDRASLTIEVLPAAAPDSGSGVVTLEETAAPATAVVLPIAPLVPVADDLASPSAVGPGTELDDSTSADDELAQLLARLRGES